MLQFNNISPDWTGSARKERRIIQEILKREAKPNAVIYFERHCSGLGDYWYWFILSTLWVSYTGWSDLNLWRKLFSSKRPNRMTSIMKPDELGIFNELPGTIIGLRAHREGETDYLSYTMSHEMALMFAKQRGTKEIISYEIQKNNVIAYFSRRGESELLILNRSNVLKVESVII